MFLIGLNQIFEKPSLFTILHTFKHKNTKKHNAYLAADVLFIGLGSINNKFAHKTTDSYYTEKPLPKVS
jgi:hypothetical protein